MKSNEQNKIWSKILGYQVGQKVRLHKCWYRGRNLEGRKGVIMNIGYDTSHSFIIYYTKVNWIKGEFQLIAQEFEPI